MELEKIIKELRRPFHPNQVEYKIQTVGAKAALCVAYVDARHVQERLNAVCGGLWNNAFREVIVNNELKAVECAITVFVSTDDPIGIRHADVGSFDNVNEEHHGLKAVYSDAFKRAAVHFGVAVSLYSHPQSFIVLDKKDLLRWNRAGKVVGITDAGEKVLRLEYTKWLKDEGVKVFGKPYELPTP